jgi:MSHA biogenesis protein MshM
MVAISLLPSMSSLYLDHFGLSRSPFKITPELEFFFSGGRRGDILAALLHVARHDEGITTVVAEVGSGKTLLSRLLLCQLPMEVSTVYLANPCFTRDEILSAIARDLGLEDLPTATEAKLARIHRELLRRHAAGQRVLLVVDEAHAMPPESLEEIRLLSNLETDAHKLVNIMLFGQPELDTVLADHRLRQVRDRIIHRFELSPWSTDDVGGYIQHRLQAAGWKGSVLFTPAALSSLAEYSSGRARRINLLADKALLAAYAEGLPTVEMRHVRSASRELRGDVVARLRPQGAQWAWAGAAAVAAVAVGVWWYDSKTGTAASLSSPPLGVEQAMPSPAVAHTMVPLPPRTAASTPSAAAPRAVASQVVPTVGAIASVAPVAPGALPVQAPASTASVPSTATPAPLADASGLQPYLERTRAVLQETPLTGYTVQLAASPRDDRALKYVVFASQQLDLNQLYAQYSSYHGQNYVSLFWGRYGTAAEARAAISTLPAELKVNRPLVRTWLKIQQDQAP